MGSKEHRYAVAVEWTGNTGTGTATYSGYSRDHLLTTPEKPAIPGSADPQFRGDAGRWNPEELLVGALAACHQLWYLHLCAGAGIRVLAYRDTASGVMRENADGSGQFAQVTLRPESRSARATMSRGPVRCTRRRVGCASSRVRSRSASCTNR